MKTVLIVDDEFGIAELLSDLLGGEGYRVITASGGREALERLEEAAPDLVLLDYMMPGLNGAQVLRAMAQAPPLSRIPVVMMSSLDQSAVAEHCAGCAAFLRKPFRLSQVVDTIAGLLAKGG